MGDSVALQSPPELTPLSPKTPPSSRGECGDSVALHSPPELTPLSPNPIPLSPKTPPSCREEWSDSVALHSPPQLGGVSGNSGVGLGESGANSRGSGKYGPP